MKTIGIFLLVFLLACMALHSQNNAVRFYGSNTNAETYGIPYFWPANVIDLKTNTVVPAGYVLMTTAQLDLCLSTNRLDHELWIKLKDEVRHEAQDANLSRLVELYGQIKAGRMLNSSVSNSLQTIEASLSSGTNTQAQVVVRIRQINGALDDVRRIQIGILELLQRLGPVLSQLYKPEFDDTK